MRFRSVLVVVSLCLVLGTSAAFGAEASSRGREERGLSSILGQLGAFLKAVWDTEAGQIDPLGRTSPETGEGDAPATPGADEGIEIDPLG